jgi:tetratricopeptide (TPR) repeat protein
MTQENLSERLNLYEAMFERNPRDGLISVGKTYLYILAGRPQDALKSSLEASLSVSSKSLRVQLAIALGYYLRNKPGEALIESRYALNIDPAGPLCYLVHASILLALNRTDEAKLAFLKCLSLASDNTFLTDLRMRNRKVICAAQLENPLLAAYSNLKLRVPDMTEADVQQLIEKNPSDPVLKALCASLQRRSGKIREALVLLETGLSSYEAFPERLYLLWKTYDDQLGNHQKGEAFVRRLLEVDPLNDRATGLGYSNLDEESLRHINFIKSLEDLPDSIFAKMLPVRELEALAATSEVDAVDTSGMTPCEEPQTMTEEPPTEPAPSASSLVTEQMLTASQPVMEHMASLLEQAQLIARELRMPPAPAPAPLLHAPVETPPVTEEVQAPTVPEEPQPAEPEEMEVDTVLQTAEAESAAPAAAAPAGPTMREANRLLSESRFEEALQAFLEISRRNRLPLRATQSR